MASLVDVTVPVGQAEGTESIVSTWFKSVGDEVTENEPLLEISTDKVNMEVAAPASGRLAEIVKGEGESIEPGDVLGRLDTAPSMSQAAAPASAPPAAASQSGQGDKLESYPQNRPRAPDLDTNPAHLSW